MGFLLLLAVPALGVYALTSRYLRKHPQLLHKPRKVPFPCQHVSHRGGCGERIENTLEAFSNALAQKTNILELDCHLTQDGVVVVSHDDNLDRQAGKNIEISKTNYADLPPYKDSLEVTFYPGHFSHGSDHRIPRLEEVFQKFPGVPVNIEIKPDNDELICKVAKLVRQFNRSEISIWASSEDSVLKKCRKANPEMPFMFSYKRGFTILFLYYVGLLPFVPLKESFLETILPSVINRSACRCLGSLVEFMAIERPSLMSFHLSMFISQVLLWVVNEEEDFAEAFSYGVSGVMTDYPTRLRKYLDAHSSLSEKKED
uniref:Glycerophosphodiester phosphodiesterase domain containing 3 n=1 Tax=Sphenodon punctatus TaxID=8508 RepID=A0A8D0H2V7_SPHPU